MFAKLALVIAALALSDALYAQPASQTTPTVPPGIQVAVAAADTAAGQTGVDNVAGDLAAAGIDPATATTAQISSVVSNLTTRAVLNMVAYLLTIPAADLTALEQELLNLLIESLPGSESS